MSPYVAPISTATATALPPADEPQVTPAEAERIERWVGVSSTVVVLLAGVAALLV